MFKLIKRLITFSLVAALLAIGLLAFQLLRFQHGAIPLDQPTTFLIRSGSNIKTISQDLARAEVIHDPWLFILLAKLRGMETRVRAGEYQIDVGISADALLETFTKGNSIQYKLTIIEGWTFRQMLTAIADDPIIEHTLAGKTDAEIMAVAASAPRDGAGSFTDTASWSAFITFATSAVTIWSQVKAGKSFR